MYFLKASPFGLVSMYHKNRDRHCGYRPVASISGRSLEPAAIIFPLEEGFFLSRILKAIPKEGGFIRHIDMSIMNKEVDNVVLQLDLTGSSHRGRLEKLPNYVSGWKWSICSTKSKARYETIARLKRFHYAFISIHLNVAVLQVRRLFQHVYTVSLADRKQLWAVENVILYRASQDVVVQDLPMDALSARMMIDGFCHDFYQDVVVQDLPMDALSARMMIDGFCHDF
nr:hypothetical protein [Tanacetum cinerariifolium]